MESAGISCIHYSTVIKFSESSTEQSAAFHFMKIAVHVIKLHCINHVHSSVHDVYDASVQWFS